MMILNISVLTLASIVSGAPLERRTFFPAPSSSQQSSMSSTSNNNNSNNNNNGVMMLGPGGGMFGMGNGQMMGMGNGQMFGTPFSSSTSSSSFDSNGTGMQPVHRESNFHTETAPRYFEEDYEDGPYGEEYEEYDNEPYGDDEIYEEEVLPPSPPRGRYSIRGSRQRGSPSYKGKYANYPDSNQLNYPPRSMMPNKRISESIRRPRGRFSRNTYDTNQVVPGSNYQVGGAIKPIPAPSKPRATAPKAPVPSKPLITAPKAPIPAKPLTTAPKSPTAAKQPSLTAPVPVEPPTAAKQTLPNIPPPMENDGNPANAIMSNGSGSSQSSSSSVEANANSSNGFQVTQSPNFEYHSYVSVPGNASPPETSESLTASQESSNTSAKMPGTSADTQAPQDPTVMSEQLNSSEGAATTEQKYQAPEETHY